MSFGSLSPGIKLSCARIPVALEMMVVSAGFNLFARPIRFALVYEPNSMADFKVVSMLLFRREAWTPPEITLPMMDETMGSAPRS